MSSQGYARRSSVAIAVALAWAICSTSALATPLDDMGITQLRLDTNNTLLGQGVIVAQPEAVGATFEINAANLLSDDPASMTLAVPLTFVYDTYFVNSTTSSSLVITNTSNSAYSSWHAGVVAANLAGTASTLPGTTTGVAPSLARILNYEANTYTNEFVLPNKSLTAHVGSHYYSPQVVNQSYVETPGGIWTAPVLEQFYDNYVAQRNYIIVSAAGNSDSPPAGDDGGISLPGTAYNVITVGCYQGSTQSSQSGVRCKPDLVAPNSYGFTSFSTAYVSGIAALLVQAAGSGDGADSRVVKALLLNGASKPFDWTHTPTEPLNHLYGAGIVNADNSYHNLMAGESGTTSQTTTASLGAAHPPTTIGNDSANGWNRATITSDVNHDAVDHYVIDLSQDNAIVTLTATLTWLRANDSALASEFTAKSNSGNFTTNFTSSINTINNLDLYLYNTTTQALVDLSNSGIDNVEHLYTLNLTPGKYDLQILKNGGDPGTANVCSNSETYGFAWNVSNIANVANNNNLVFNQTNAVTISSPIIGAGTLTHAGTGTTTLTAYQGTGPVNLNAGKLVVAPTSAARQNTGVMTQMNRLTIAPGGTLDVNNHDLMIGNANLTTVETQILAGLNKSLPNGTPSSPTDPTITSTTALTDGNKFLVPLDADVLLGDGTLGSAIGQTWDNVTITQPHTVIVKYTYYGDADLNGYVDFGDYGPILDNFGKTTPGLADIFTSWLMGDLDFSGKVDFGDYGPILDNFGQGSGHPLGTMEPAGLVILPVPEPGSLMLLGMGVFLLLTGRPIARRSTKWMHAP